MVNAAGSVHVPTHLSLATSRNLAVTGNIHLQVLHNIAQCRSTDPQSRTSESRVYLTPSITSSKVLLKVVPVLLHNDSNSVETFAVLDDGAQRTMILPTAVQQLRLNGESETLALRTVRTDVTHLQGLKVNFEISPRGNPQKRFNVQGAFTAAGLDLVEQTYPVQMLQKRHSHLRGIPLKSFNKVRPLVLLGSDHVHHGHGANPQRIQRWNHSLPYCPRMGPAGIREVCARTNISNPVFFHLIRQPR